MTWRMGIPYCLLLFFFSYHPLYSQTQNDYPLYQEGIIYLQLKESSGIELTMPHGPNLDSLEQLIYDAFDHHAVSQLELAFESLPPTKFDYLYRVVLEEGNEVALIEVLSNIEVVEFAERVPYNFIIGMPDDPFVLNNASYHLPLINAYDAFDIHMASGVTVAIVDNAFFAGHEDLADNVQAGNQYDVTTGDNDTRPPYTADQYDQISWRHGTHVAGIAGAVTNNGIGVASPGWDNDLLLIKATADSDNPGTINYGYEGIEEACLRGADVISLSLGWIYRITSGI